MREILFKAKRLDNGEWTQGDLMQHEESGRCIIGGIFAIGKYGYIDTDYHEVDPETVCQFTGLTDKNGNKIWEHDIVLSVSASVPWKAKVVWEQAEYDMIGIDNLLKLPLYGYHINDIEVIGNLYDEEAKYEHYA